MFTTPGSPVDRLLTASLLLAPMTTLVSSFMFAANGWEDGAAGAVQVAAGILDFLLVVRLVTWLDATAWMTPVVLGLGALGAGGWVAYGINTIETSLGNVDLVDVSGAATIIKPLGLCWPVMLILVGIVLLRAHRVPVGSGIAIAVAGLLMPISRIGNIWQLAIVVDVLLLAGLLWAAARLRYRTDTSPAGVRASATASDPARSPSPKVVVAGPRQ